LRSATNLFKKTRETRIGYPTEEVDLVLPADPEAPSTAPDAIISSHWVLRDGTVAGLGR